MADHETIYYIQDLGKYTQVISGNSRLNPTVGITERHHECRIKWICVFFAPRGKRLNQFCCSITESASSHLHTLPPPETCRPLTSKALDACHFLRLVIPSWINSDILIILFVSQSSLFNVFLFIFHWLIIPLSFVLLISLSSIIDSVPLLIISNMVLYIY